MSVPVNEANETTALLHELMETVTKEARGVFVSRLDELVYERHGSRDAIVLGIAVDDAAHTDLEWLQEHLADKASDEIDRLRGFIESLIDDRDDARAEVERLKSDSSWGALRRLDDEWRAESSAAFLRGAEAMREAAMGAAWHSNAMGVHNKIRALPIPEDTP